MHHVDRAASASCHHCDSRRDDAEHTLFDCPNWSGHRDELSARLGHRPCPVDMQEILCGPDFDALPADSAERAVALDNAEESFRLFYKMVESIQSIKEQEERARQAAYHRG